MWYVEVVMKTKVVIVVADGVMVKSMGSTGLGVLFYWPPNGAGGGGGGVGNFAFKALGRAPDIIFL